MLQLLDYFNFIIAIYDPSFLEEKRKIFARITISEEEEEDESKNGPARGF